MYRVFKQFFVVACIVVYKLLADATKLRGPFDVNTITIIVGLKGSTYMYNVPRHVFDLILTRHKSCVSYRNKRRGRMFSEKKQPSAVWF